MGNMDVTDRASYERAELTDRRADRTFQVRSGRRLVITNLILLAIAIPLSIAAASALEGWADWVVLGAIVVLTIGAMIAITTRPGGGVDEQG